MITVRLSSSWTSAVSRQSSRCLKGCPSVTDSRLPTIQNTKKKLSEFLQFVLGPDGQRIFNECNHPELVPPECDNVNALPDSLKPLFR